MHSILRTARTPFRHGVALSGCALLLAISVGGVGAAQSVPTWDPEADSLDWTGRSATAAAARKEAGAALVEGRRQCAREPRRADRDACQAKVLADHRAATKRLRERSDRRAN